MEGAPSAFQRWWRALFVSLGSRYTFACVVYAIYASLIIYLNGVAAPLYAAASASGSASAPALLATVNNIYLISALIHLFNAMQFTHAWFSSGFRLWHVILLPDWLNIIGASIYLYTATLYPQTCAPYNVGSCLDPLTMQVHYFETAAAYIELAASIGWFLSWWLTFPRIAGRGWTLDDPDLWALVFTFVPSIFYCMYNGQILANPSLYGSNFLCAFASSSGRRARAGACVWVGSRAALPKRSLALARSRLCRSFITGSFLFDRCEGSAGESIAFTSRCEIHRTRT